MSEAGQHLGQHQALSLPLAVEFLIHHEFRMTCPCSLTRTCSFRSLICLHINLPFIIFGLVFLGRPSFSRLGWTSLIPPFPSLFSSFPALTGAFWKRVAGIGEQVSGRGLCPIQEAVPAWRPGFLAQVTTDLYSSVF